ncbi:MAG: glycosyltransferase family 4 protein [Thiobacillaceae bacterium]
MNTLGILFLNPDTRRDAGCNISLLSLINGLDARYHAVVATPADGEFAELLRAQKIEVVDYRMNNWWYPDPEHFFRHAAGFQARIQQLADLIRERQFRLVHSNAEYAFEGALAAALVGVPHVWNIRQTFGSDMDVLRFFPLSPLALGEMMSALSDRIVPNAQPLIGTFPANIPPEKLSVIPSGIKLTNLPDRATARTALRKRLNLPEGACVILTMSRISPEKDLATFIQTARTLMYRNRREPLHFVHVGSVYNATYFEQMKALLGDLSNVFSFVGSVGAPLEILRGADILLFTSTAFEGMARVCLEALLMELPIVATRCLGPEEYLLHGETALLADPGDADTLATHIETLLDTPGYGETLAQNGNRLVQARYNEKRVCTLWMTLYNELTSASRTPMATHAATETAINLISLCGQLGERIEELEKRLRRLEHLARLIDSPVRFGKRLLKAFMPSRGGERL